MDGFVYAGCPPATMLYTCGPSNFLPDSGLTEAARWTWGQGSDDNRQSVAILQGTNLWCHDVAEVSLVAGCLSLLSHIVIRPFFFSVFILFIALGY
ncbi:hypothetical protein OF83DRAFT_1105004 [Amylostereum chailletii]|nr:hypothetical protein OF83DRAFT_1105004 [Amylostereum chailletii]